METEGQPRFEVLRQQMRTVPEGLVLEGQVSADAVDRSLTRPKLVREGGVGESSVFSCHCIDKPDQGLVVPHGLDFLPSRDLKRLFLFNCLLNALDQFRPASERLFHVGDGHFLPFVPGEEEVERQERFMAVCVSEKFLCQTCSINILMFLVASPRQKAGEGKEHVRLVVLHKTKK